MRTKPLGSTCRKKRRKNSVDTNPVENVRLPAERRGRKTSKPYLYPKQFEDLVVLIPEPYASLVYVAIYTGLRISELAGFAGMTCMRVQSRSMSGTAVAT